MNMNMSMSQYYIGQRVVASDGAQYTLTHHAEGVWWAQRVGANAIPQPIVPRYPAWGGDDDRAGADQAGALPRARARSRRTRELRKAT